MVAFDWRVRRHGERPAIYGRDRERALLHELAAEAAAGLGSLALVSGEAGIGKTTLVNDLITHARDQGALVLSGGCYDLTTTPPYGPWSEVIRSYKPQQHQPNIPSWFGDPEAMEQVGSQAALFDETLRFFAAIAEHQPLVIVLEDLHWADSASLEALRYLARSLSNIAVLLVATYREDEVTRRHDLYQLLPILVRESRPERIHLNPLARHDIWEMVTGRYNLPTTDIERLVLHLSTQSQGNPFFAEEILQGLQDQRVLLPIAGGWKLGDLEQTRMPSLLRQALELLLARLSAETRAALWTAAVIGQRVPIDLWLDVAGLERERFERAITESLEAHVLQEIGSENSLQFRHALLHEALYASIAIGQRRDLHHRVGEALATKGNADPDTVAYHFEISGDQRAAHWWIRAGVRAQSIYALQVAADCYATARALLEDDPHLAQARGWLLLHTGHMMRDLEPKRGADYVEDAAYVAQLVDDPLLVAYSEHVHGLLRTYQDDIGTGLKEMESARTRWELVTASQKQHASQAITSLFPNEMLSSPRVAAGNLLHRAVSVPEVNTFTNIYSTFLATTGQFREALRVGVPFVEQVPIVTDETQTIHDVCAVAYQGLAVAADWLGCPEEARCWRARALEAFRAVRYSVQIRHVLSHEITHILAYQTDQVEIRRRVVEALLDTAELPGGTLQGHPLNSLKLNVDLLEGCWETARDTVNRSFGARDPYARVIRMRGFRVLGREQHDEHFATAVWTDIYAALPEGSATEPGQEDHEYGVLAQQLAADLTLDAGDLKSACGWITAHDRWIAWSESVFGRAEAQLLWARYHRIAGDLERARQHAEQALEYATDPRQPLALIIVYRTLGQLGTETGQYDEARENLQSSLALAEQCEAPYERALTMLKLAELAASTGDSDEALLLLVEVRSVCESLGAHRTLDRVDVLETEIQDQPRATTTAFGLTPRELDVLQAVAEGLTDAEAGKMLSISARTVSHHLRSIYSKLEVNNRAAAVRIAMEHELI